MSDHTPVKLQFKNDVNYKAYRIKILDINESSNEYNTGSSLDGWAAYNWRWDRISTVEMYDSFADAVQSYSEVGGFASQTSNWPNGIWNDEQYGGDIIHPSSSGNNFGNNYIQFQMKRPISVNAFGSKTRSHGGANYHGTIRLSGSHNASSWTQLAEYTGDGIYVDFQDVNNIADTTKYSHYRVDMYNNGRTDFQSLSQIRIQLRGEL
jgi:hypothetical protein